MKRCPRCLGLAAAAADVCRVDGAVLCWTGPTAGIRNPTEPSDAGVATRVGPVPGPEDRGADDGGGVGAGFGGGQDAASSPRANTFLYGRAEAAKSLPQLRQSQPIPSDAGQASGQAGAARTAAPRPAPVGPDSGSGGRATAGAAPAAPGRQTSPRGSVPASADAGTPPPWPAGARPATSADDDGEAERPTLVTSLEGAGKIDDADAERSAYVGKLIDERYLVKELLGRGGMGAVFRVEQIHLRKEMAIKLLHENLLARKQLVSRFTREARAISRLSSQHTVMVYDFGRWGEVFYLVMELLEGEPLDAALEREGPLPADRATAILVQMCDSLAEAHEHGIVHRDLKPENVMLLRNAAHPDFVKILDFGLAKVEDVDDPYTIHSQKDIFGTPFYMSPEQIRAGDVDGRSDIYALGALTFRMLTGRQVFGHERSTFDILKAHLMEKPPRMVDVAPPGLAIPAALEVVVARCLEKEPAARFASMRELSDALVQARKGPLAARPQPAEVAATPSPATATRPYDDSANRGEARLALDEDALDRHVRRGRMWRAAAVVTLVAALAAAGAWLLRAGGDLGQESEPNDRHDQASRIDPATRQVRGSLGARSSAQAGDRDCFALPPGAELIDLSVSPLPNCDLELLLLDAGGSVIGRIDHQGPDQGESIAHAGGDGAMPTTVCVQERVQQGKTAHESGSDFYTLRVERRARLGPTEREPNDKEPSGALPAGLSLRGRLDGPLDVDWFELGERLEGRIVRVHVEAPDGQALHGMRVALHDAHGRTLASETFRSDQRAGVLAFASSFATAERVSLRWATPPAAGNAGTYALWSKAEPVADQGEGEPNNTAASAFPLVVGAHHGGDVDDAAAVDWFRVDGGDPALSRAIIELSTPPGSAVRLFVHEPAARVDVREVSVDDRGGAVDQRVETRGAGLLLRLERAVSAGRRGKAAEGRYRLRVRWASAEQDAPAHR